MNTGLTGRTALVTGGSKGIGRAVALALARQGVDVAICARGAGELEQAADAIRALGVRALALPTDMTEPEAVRAFVDTAADHFGRIDILVNNAVTSTQNTFAALSDEEFRYHIDVKVMGYIRCAREVVSGMRAAGWGRIVNISGLAARQTGNAVGSMRNIAVAALTKNLADELGPAGIQVNVVHPGVTRTERTAPLVAERARASGRSEAEVEAEMAASNSIRHLVTAEEVAWIVAFLCSPRSRAINGDVIAAGGGAPRVIHY